MTDKSTTLINQGNGYLQMKNLRKKEQEESIIMKENNGKKDNALKEGFVESMSISDTNQTELDKLNTLKGEFDSAMSSYASIQKSLNDMSIQYIEDEKNKDQKNYYARSFPKVDIKKINHEGCYNDKSSRAVPIWKGYMSKEDCAQAANEQGYNVFSLQYGNTDPGWWQRTDEDGTRGNIPKKGHCFVGNDLNEAKKYGPGHYRKWRWALSWQWGFKNQWVDRRWKRMSYFKDYMRYYWRMLGRGNNWQDYKNNYVYKHDIFFGPSNDGRVILTFKEHQTGELIWTNTNRAVKNKIEWKQELNTDYGGNDIRNFRNISVEDCHKKCADDDNCVGHNHLGKEKKCWIKNKKQNKTKWDSKDEMDFYTKTKIPVKSFLIVQDDGNVVLYRGTGPSDNQGVLHSFRTNERIWSPQYLEKNQNWLDKRKYGRSYITNNDYLKKGEFISSDNGLHALYLWWDGNIVIGSNYTKCRKSQGVDVGGVWSNDVYTIPKSNIRNIGKGFYKDENGNKLEYKESDIRYGTTYELAKKNWNTWGNDLGTQWVKTVEQAKAVCNTDPKCAGFVYEKVADYPWITDGWNRVHKKSKDMWPYGESGRKNSGFHAHCDTYVRDIKLNNNYSCNENVDEYINTDKYNTISGSSEPRITYSVQEKTDSGGNDIKYMQGASFKECEDACSADDNCKGFNRKHNMTDGCWIKHSVSNAKSNGSSDLYTKNKVASSGMDGYMGQNNFCSIKQSTSQERNILEKKKAVLGERIKEILNEMKILTSKAKKYNNLKNEKREDRIKMVYNYEQIFKRLAQEEKDLSTLDEQEDNEELILVSENYKYITWSIIAIMIIIATLKIMKKQ